MENGSMTMLTASYGYICHRGNADAPDVFVIYDLEDSPKTAREDFPAVYYDLTRNLGRGLWNELFLYLDIEGCYQGIMIIGDTPVVYEPIAGVTITDEQEAVEAVRAFLRRSREQRKGGSAHG